MVDDFIKVLGIASFITLTILLSVFYGHLQTIKTVSVDMKPINQRCIGEWKLELIGVNNQFIKLYCVNQHTSELRVDAVSRQTRSKNNE